MQEITAEKKDWDEEVSVYHRKQWDAWKVEVCHLQNMYVSRCYTPDEFGESLPRTPHCFSDAAEIGYGQVSYLCSVNNEGKIHVSLVAAKSHVTALKPVTMPRLELAAATVSAKMSAMLLHKLDIGKIISTFWTDSQIV